MKKILVLASNPKKTSLLDLDREIRDIREGLQRSLELDTAYKRLQKSLEARSWQQADLETFALMLKIAECERKGYLDTKDINEFPERYLQLIDQLWIQPQQSNRASPLGRLGRFRKIQEMAFGLSLCTTGIEGWKLDFWETQVMINDRH